MIRLVLFFVVVLAATVGLSWLADRPGALILNWQGYEIETTVFRAVVIFAFTITLAVMLWSIARNIWQSPAALGNLMNRRRQTRGIDALSSGMIAIGAGDKAAATRYAVQARKSLPNEPLTHLLRAQAAQLSGDRATSRRIFEAMLASPDTEQLGLRGLFLEAQREGESEAARQFAERALRLNPKLPWAADALFELQCRQHDWQGALETLATARKHGQVERKIADRRRAVLLTALAQKADDSDPVRAQQLALEAHGLANDLVPAAVIAGRHLASKGNTGRAAKVLQAAWRLSPHPDLATIYAFARPGDSPKDRLERVRGLVRQTPYSSEGPIALATAAIDAHAFDEAKRALEPLIEDGLSQRVCMLMARIEGEAGNKGGVREWLARAVTAQRDPSWTADGVVSDRWMAVSPVTGQLDVFQWKMPGERLEKEDATLLAERVEKLVALGAAEEPDAKTIEVAPAVAETTAVVARPVVSTPVAAHPQPSSEDAKRPTERPVPSPAGPAIAVPVAPAAVTDGASAKAVMAAPAPGKPAVAVVPVNREKVTEAAVVIGNGVAGIQNSPVTPLPRAGSGDGRVIPAPSNSKGDQRRSGEPRYYPTARAPDDPGPDAEVSEPAVGAFQSTRKV